MGKRKGKLVPHLRLKTPYTRFASDFWACYKEHGHQQALIAKPRFDEKEKRILFEFCDNFDCTASEGPEITGVLSTRTSLVDLNKNSSPQSAATQANDRSPSVAPLARPEIPLESPKSDILPSSASTLTAPSCGTMDPCAPTRSLDNSNVEDDVELLPDPDLTSPCNQIDVTTSSSSDPRERQGKIIGVVSKIISQKWASSSEDLKDEYRRQTAEEKSSFLETMIAVHLRNGLPLPLVRIEHSACMTKLFRSLYQWYKQRPDILDLGYLTRSGTDPVVSALRAKCAKLMKREADHINRLFASKTVINLDLARGQGRGDATADFTSGTSISSQSPRSDQASSIYSSFTDCPIASSTPEKPAYNSHAVTPDFKVKLQNIRGSQGQSLRTLHTIEPCYTPPPRTLTSKPGSGSSLQPLSPPLTPVFTPKLAGSNFVRPPPPPPPPPSMLYSLCGVPQGGNTEEKPTLSMSNWVNTLSGSQYPANQTQGPFIYPFSPRFVYPAYQWTAADLPNLTPYPLSTPALQRTDDMYPPSSVPLSPSTGQGSPVQGNDLYFSQQSHCFNSIGNF
ncbi:hypothetical protein ACHWQZ_G006195 [Mnemiopsis leidyi]